MKKVPKNVKKGDNFQQGIDLVTSYVVYYGTCSRLKKNDFSKYKMV